MRYVNIEHDAGHDALVNFEFDVHKPYRACLLCGVVFQTPADRIDGQSFLELVHSQSRRQEWAARHAKQHTSKEHRDFQKSGRFCTPLAAIRLVPLGIAPLSDIVASVEHEHASAVAPRAPINDAEDHIVRR